MTGQVDSVNPSGAVALSSVFAPLTLNPNVDVRSAELVPPGKVVPVSCTVRAVTPVPELTSNCNWLALGGTTPCSKSEPTPKPFALFGAPGRVIPEMVGWALVRLLDNKTAIAAIPARKGVFISISVAKPRFVRTIPESGEYRFLLITAFGDCAAIFAFAKLLG